MKVREIFENEIRNINIKRFNLENSVNRQERLNSQQAFGQYLDYESEDYFSHPKFRDWPAIIEPKLLRVKKYLQGNILELGAGTCKASAFISKLEAVKSLTCVEFSDVMLTEVAPRVILHYGGELSKFRFIVSDMHQTENFSDFKYDAIVLYTALHHVFLPYFQIEKWYEMLKPNGAVICISEPALANTVLPTRANREWIDNQINHQRQGNNENYYQVSYFRKLFTKFKKFDFFFIDSSNWHRSLLDKIKRTIWFRRINIFFVAVKK